MNIQAAWIALFAEQVPTDTDFDEAATLIHGLEEIGSEITLDEAVLERVDDYLNGPSAFIAANDQDVRVPQWTRHAASIESPSEGSEAISSGGASSTASAPAEGLSATAFLNAGTGADPSLGGVSISNSKEAAQSTRKDQGDPRVKTILVPLSQVRRPVLVASRDIPSLTKEILAHETYVRYRTWLIGAFNSLRNGTDAEKASRATELRDTRAYLVLLRKSDKHLIPSCVAHLEDLIKALEAKRDQSEPEWFQANYVTGEYS